MSYRIARLLHCLDVRIGRMLEKECPQQHMQDVTGANGRIIRFLAEHEDEEIYQKDLERTFGITRSTASRVVGLMEQKGLVRREGVEWDARLKRVTLTERSRALSQRMCQIGRAMDERLLKGFSDAERDQLMAYLARMQGNLG